MKRTFNVNIEGQHPIPTPLEIRTELPIMAHTADAVHAFRKSIAEIIARKDRRLLVIAGPCSIDDTESALEYARRLKLLQDDVSSKFLIVMRTYFEKPRTSLGWKGLISDPDLSGESCEIEKGLRIARKLLLEIGGMGIPAATEFLDPVIPQYLADLVSWAAIGVRTTESQTHRQMASGFSMPTGFKNSTDGKISVAVDAIKAAGAKHSFLGVTEDGRMGVFNTKGNKHCHVVLRGGSDGPNYGSEHIAFAKELMRKASLTPSIVIDCSHGNSMKRPERQLVAFRDAVAQVAAGQDAISGVMLESYLLPGSQELKDGVVRTPGVSVTDPCLGWDDTESAIRKAYSSL